MPQQVVADKNWEEKMPSILKDYTPEIFSDLKKLSEDTMKDGALSAKFKELTAIALSIAAGCEPCVKIHTRRALQLGATKDEISEIIGVAVLLLGGPADVWPTEIIINEIQKFDN